MVSAVPLFFEDGDASPMASPGCRAALTESEETGWGVALDELRTRTRTQGGTLTQLRKIVVPLKACPSLECNVASVCIRSLNNCTLTALT